MTDPELHALAEKLGAKVVGRVPNTGGGVTGGGGLCAHHLAHIVRNMKKDTTMSSKEEKTNSLFKFLSRHR
jgi:hypothetical protein